MTRRRRWLLTSSAALALVLIVFGRPTFLVVRAWLRDQPAPEEIPTGFTDDASRLNRTRVAEIWNIPEEPAPAEDQLRRLLARARADGLKVAIAGARHSQGGHTITPDGIVVNMLPFRRLELLADENLLRAGAGARWSEIVSYLDSRGFSVAVMQSNHDFSVGGSLSVNCHGWPCRRAPIASTVESLRLMKADGSVVRCSRHEHAELFRLVLGGYGLFGIILDAELRVVRNERLRAEAEVIATERYAAQYAERVTADAGMAYGRLCVVPGERFLREAILTVFRQAPCDASEVPALESPGYATLRREVFRAQIGSDAGKEMRWRAERRFGEFSRSRLFSRNQLLNEPSDVFREQNADRTDILHEYFVPAPRLEEFLARLRRILPEHRSLDLLNVTIREVRTDHDAFLRYADCDMFALVMLFNQPRAPAAEPQMQTLTRALIDAALECGGRYYLPYRLHATPEQFHRAYPQAKEFFERKRAHDPEGLFDNQFYRTYGMP